jgi:hypothetical protein
LKEIEKISSGYFAFGGEDLRENEGKCVEIISIFWYL